MTSLSKILMVIGALLFIIGFLIQFLHLGRLPGDVVIKKGNATFYFPLVTSIIVSIVLSLFFYFLGRFR
ncbi:DUF2905 domain-containing protein [Neobacillus cucumis]|uniref:DUF2905 domain-containing protein n=1 Tax=Neobacillus cucumis TaxID=1740721 RepID=UPI00203FC8C3|nr:DUF2905 domain-containing protein [Neobacillus cucumis]MCM3725263.1 DUF2905 domain-containing protein [Neobacillus cucumis]